MCDGFWFFFSLLGLKSCYGFFFSFSFFLFDFHLPKKREKKEEEEEEERKGFCDKSHTVGTMNLY